MAGGVGLSREEDAEVRVKMAAMTEAARRADPRYEGDDSIFARAGLAMAEMAPPMVISLGLAGLVPAPAAGAGRKAVWGLKAAEVAAVATPFYPMIQDETYDAMLQEGIDPSLAKPISVGFSAIEAGVEGIEGNWLRKTAAGKATSRGLRASMMRWAKEYGKRYGKEWSEEGAQAFINYLGREAARILDKNHAPHGVKEGVKQVADAMAESGLPLAGAMMPGAVPSAIQAFRAGRAGEKQLLTPAGIAAWTLQNPEEAAALVADGRDSRTPWKEAGLPTKDTNPGFRAGAIQFIRKILARRKAVMQQQAAQEALGAPEAALGPEAAQPAEVAPEATGEAGLPVAERLEPTLPEQLQTAKQREERQFAAEGRPRAETLWGTKWTSEVVGARADSLRPSPEALGAVAPGTPLPAEERTLRDEIDEVMEPGFLGAFRKAHGVERIPLRERLGTLLDAAWRKATRHFEHLPRRSPNLEAIHSLRIDQEAKHIAEDETARTVTDVVAPLTKDELELFELKVVLDNQLAERSKAVPGPLRHRLASTEAVQAEVAKVDAMLANNPQVQRALELRRRYVHDLTQRLVESDILPQAALESAETYYHQQILAHYGLREWYSRQRKIKPGRPGFTRKRLVGPEELPEEFDPNTSYAEAEFEWMAAAHIALHHARTRQQLEQHYDRMNEFREKAKENETTPQHEVNKWNKEHPGQQFVVYQWKPGTTVYPAFTIPEKLVEQIEKGILDESALSPEQIRRVLALGGKHRQMVFPEQLAKQLDSMDQPKPLEEIERASAAVMRGLKFLYLLAPHRIVGYFARNLTGDADPSLIGTAPGVAKYVPRAMRELWDMYYGGKLEMGPDLRAARDEGVLSATFAVQELTNVKELKPLKRFTDRRAPLHSVPGKVAAGYAREARKASNFREAWLRYAAFLYGKDQLRAGTLTHAGGSNRHQLKAIQEAFGIDAAAAHWSRNLLGDYSNLTVLGDWLRKHLIPFWSFQEINIKRYPMMTANAWHAGAAKGGLTGAGVSVALMIRVFGAAGVLWFWNNIFFGDDEEELSQQERSNPHINLGRNADGTIRIFRRPGASAEFLEWAGLNELPTVLRQWQDGQIGIGAIPEHMGKAFVNKIIQGLHPAYKGIPEVLTEQAYFPDVFTPRTKERGATIAATVTMEDAYRWSKGMILGKGDRARPHVFRRWFMGVVNPKQQALHDVYDWRNDFLKSKGTPEKGVYPISQYQQARRAAYNEDYEAFKEWHDDWYPRQGSPRQAAKKFKDFLRRLDPIAARLKDRDEREFEQEFLTAPQRQRLIVARDYSKELRDRLIQWWYVAASPPSPR
jgi:hypothetical protein